MPSPIYDPGYIKRRSSPAGVGIGQHTLTDTEYAAFLILQPLAGKDILIDSNHDLVVDSGGNTIYGAPT